LFDPIVTGLGYQLWGIEYRSSQKHALIKIFIDHEDGVTLDHCSEVSHQVSAILDVEDPITVPYTLEVSSPGVERPLLKLAHYQRYIGSEIKVRLIWALDGQKNFKGELLRVESDNITMLADEVEVSFSIDTIKRAHLIYL
jgi:ribosome maturation factor RimP